MCLEDSVDVIIPVFNQFSLVKRCINSVLNAKNKISSEIIVINDCSTESDLNNYLVHLSDNKLITLFVNKKNMGFTKSVNFGMKLHLARDVILLNSDTCVYGNWIERLRDSAYSETNIASSIPLSNACHISNYPKREGGNDFELEIDDKTLDELASQPPYIYAKVPSTVGFCMYIKRIALNAVGYFDDSNFPIGYGEETDFCYRTRKIGWEHIVAGNVFVRHFEGSSSFGDKKAKLMREMLKKIIILHPNLPSEDAKLLRFDPVWLLRERLDILRLKKALNGAQSLRIFSDRKNKKDSSVNNDFFLTFSQKDGSINFYSTNIQNFPNLSSYLLPRDIIFFNSLMIFLGINKLYCSSNKDKIFLKDLTAGLSFEIKLSVRISVKP